MSEILTVLSPWAEVDASLITGLSPRLDTLNGKTIGMFSDFMNSATFMLNAVEKEILKRWPEAKFSYLQYLTETTRIEEDEEFLPVFEEWISGVDACLSFYGAVPSSSLFLGYNSAYMEKRGKPTVMAVTPRTYPAAIRGCKAIGVPGLRTIQYLSPTDIYGHQGEEDVIRAMDPIVAEVTDQLTDGLLRPLTPEEKDPSAPDQHYARDRISGTVSEINALFYKNGWTNGQPIVMPTEEAVEEMLRGTDLPRDHVVGKIPPKMGLATVEKIAVNAVMAGCLPTYLPVLIAAVKGALDKKIYLEGWTCSQSTWGPMLTLSGPIVRDIGLNTGGNALSPYYKANATIARAFGYIMMNIGGLRPNIEDLSEMGHENRLGLCAGDDPEENPWGPLHTDFGFAPEDSAVTMFWPMEHQAMSGMSVPGLLKWLCSFNPLGWEPGAALIFSPKAAKLFADAGWTKKRVLEYMVEYCRRPASEVDIAWLVNNNHPPETVDIPQVMTHSTRVFWSTKHMFALVAGGKAGAMITAFLGGGDHGGPSCTKIELPKDWDALVAEYAAVRPEYIDY